MSRKSNQQPVQSSINDLLNSVAKTNDTKKSKIPLINEPEMHESVNDYISANRELKDAKVKLEIAEKTVIEAGDNWYKKQSGELNSVKFAGTEGAVLVTYKDAFVKITKDIADELKLRLKEKFDNFFREKRVIKLKDSATGNDTIEFLVKTLGQEKFIELFDVEINTVAVEDMDKKQFELNESVRSLISQYKPSLRVS